MDIVVASPEDVPEEVLAEQRELEMAKEDLALKPENIRGKIVEGRSKKFTESQVSVHVSFESVTCMGWLPLYTESALCQSCVCKCRRGLTCVLNSRAGSAEHAVL
jgi:hypothetical protein